jgi:hypothetical protein
VNWIGLLMTNPVILPFRFVDVSSNGFNCRFYRVMIGP